MGEVHERALVQALRRGEAAAFDAAYARWRPRLYTFLLRLSGRRELAEDLLQETWLRLAVRAPALREDTDLGAFLFTVARNLHRSRARWARVDAAARAVLGRSAHEADLRSPFEAAAASETERRLEAALLALPVRYREPLLLVAVEGLPQAQAAAVLGLRPDALRQRLSRARAMLDAALSPASPEVPDAHPARR